MRKIKRFIFPGISLLVSALVSLLFTSGLLFGFIGTHFFQKKIIGRKKLFLTLGRQRIHLHHWLMGVLFLLLLWLVGWLGILPKFCLGGTVGIICHDLFTDKNWYRILVKR